ncbi:hypothetical protein [Nonomuraea soli]|uniref:Uncharacterized protein n=1 Tax=Nonomuraea soli TaxID=1032476 RepID=A0A7W0CUG7_9ACTN|nr:hypothetical protein [Nonomuraea soli]MBA2897380.1 hypothetical protein [Nonomuraea soli]
MPTDLPPLVWNGGRRRYLLAWERRSDGWWAHLHHLEISPEPAFSLADVFVTVDDWQPAAAVEQIVGQDYSKVGRTNAAPEDCL